MAQDRSRAAVPLYHEPSWFDKFKMGALMGGTVGVCLGFLFGSYQVLFHGPGQHGYMGTMSRAMLSSGTTFGFFMGIGTVIRTEEADPMRQLISKRMGAVPLRRLEVYVEDREAVTRMM
ncbi:hypothetical protein M427DRAFT_458065 [Gonapodya prolifera JEL478]|uniref:Mitochondrial genome maintenance protein Mgr2 n=1 Tax=Gonapodya prolifera (strain JEL478) TaxID=1344416 RepID=A0A139A3C6_GONPJ|nr:hypothetical protein M427DRAFT_458065 [Gonapodya prolifera JEL478]|eukprot:KXS10985.1 hypothetical protein M427DRAFT_458065 [Gonapodya prolifera JEL478]